jgi:hypothetical protein
MRIDGKTERLLELPAGVNIFLGSSSLRGNWLAVSKKLISLGAIHGF